MKRATTDDTRTALLRAAEQIIIVEGLNALSSRRIGAVSGQNSTLITYHFGGVDGLLAELCRLNQGPMLEEWRMLDSPLPEGDLALDHLLIFWLRPLWRSAALTPDERALVVLDEIASHASDEVREPLLKNIVIINDKVLEICASLLPHLKRSTLRMRIRLIGAMTMGNAPRSTARNPFRKTRDMRYFHASLAFAKTGLLEPEYDNHFAKLARAVRVG
ncbi:MAG: TetR family transcriptional regulator [Novosphingobium sp.]|nr:TetR family transcriptional regulator [Novosphingobium sp.]